MSFLGRDTTIIVNHILSELERDPSLLTTSAIIKLFHGLCQAQSKTFFPANYKLLDYIQGKIPDLIEEMDSDDLAYLFLLCCRSQFHLNPPSYRLPRSLTMVHDKLRENIEELTEKSVLNIIEGYQDLPLEFHSELLEELKHSAMQTIRYKPADIGSEFLMQFFEMATSFKLLKGRRLNNEEIIIVYKELEHRIINDEYFAPLINVNALAELYMKLGVEYKPLIEKMCERLSMKEGFYDHIVRCVHQAGINISSIVDSYFKNENVMKNFDNQNIMIAFILMSSFGEKYKALTNYFKAKLLEPDVDLTKLIYIINDKELDNPHIREVLLEVFFK